ncbi:MAG TPA: hypothetical protein VFC18_00215 [Burkholderiales bacterium]|nr:hypothetical protein [Burkholderiales bacterium]
MGRLVLAFAALLFSVGASGQEYAGIWTAKHPNGSVVTLELEQSGPGGVTGKLQGSGARFDVDAEVRADGIVGLVSGDNAMVYLTGRLSGETLNILLMEPKANGEPDEATRRIIRFTR